MLRGLVRTMRPHQWVKNLFVLAPLVFAKELFDAPMVARAAVGFFAFSLAASAVYVLNDLVDVAADRAHPIKRNRPIASGVVTERAATRALVALVLVALAMSAPLAWELAVTVAAYFALNVAYSYKLKKIAYVDVLCIAAGFELRVLAGSFAAKVPPSAYLLVATLLLSLYLGFGKRMHELVASAGGGKTRSVLTRYSRRTLTALLYATALATIATYVVYTLDPDTRATFGTDWLPITAVFGAFGLLRFLHLVRRDGRSDSPTEEMLRDKLFLGNLALWVVAVVAAIYLG
jgi:4-hydroxybenzoate polyprenyltransferase